MTTFLRFLKGSQPHLLRYLILCAVFLSPVMTVAEDLSAPPVPSSEPTPPSTGWSWKGLQDSINRYSKDTLGATPEEQLKRSLAFEYKVAQFPLSITATQLQVSLNELGAERWECSVHASPTALRAICKRRPTSYLRLMSSLW